MDNACFVRFVSNRTTRFQHDTTRSTLSCAGGREDSQHGNPGSGSVMIPRASGPAITGQDPRKMFSPPGPEQGHSSVTAYSAPDYCLQFTSGNYEGVQCGASLQSSLVTNLLPEWVFGWQLAILLDKATSWYNLSTIFNGMFIKSININIYLMSVLYQSPSLHFHHQIFRTSLGGKHSVSG